MRSNRNREARRQVEAARQLGAAHVVQTTSIRKAIKETRALTPKNRGVDIAIEAVGVPDAWQEAWNWCAREAA